MKSNLNLRLFVLLSISIFGGLSHSKEIKSEVREFGDYRALITKDYDSGFGKVTITKKGKRIFEEGDFGHYYYFGNHFDEALKEKDPHSGTNITGNKITNLVISKWTAGAHCCNYLYIFELGKKFRKLTTVEGGSYSIEIVDLDKDGIPEIDFWDGAIDYVFASFAFSPPGRVVLRFKNDHYEVATDLMKKAAPSKKEMNKIKNRALAGFKKNESPDIPYELLEFMMNLSYSGHLTLALKIADEAWPSKKMGLAEFKKEFLDSLRSSPYWKEF